VKRLLLSMFTLAIVIPSLARAAARDDATLEDVQRLQDDLANLDDQLASLNAEDPKTDAFRQRAEDIREETVYLKVKIRRHVKAGLGGTGVGYDEVADLRRLVSDLRDDLDRASVSSSREVTLNEGTEILVRLDDSVSSRTARREDRLEATIYEPVRSDGILAIPAGSRIRGIVRDAEPAELPNKAGRLDLEFDAVYLNSERLDLRGRVVSIEHAEDRGARKAGIGAILGGILGGIIGGSKGAVIGVVIGGTGAVAATKGDDLSLPAGSILTVRLEEPLTIHRR
jgi:hypothetical protein